MAKDAIRAATGLRSRDNGFLRIQIIRAAASVPTNIVEGSGQESSKDFVRYLRYALNSANELEYHWILAHDIRAIRSDDFDRLAVQTTEIQRMLNGLIRKLRS